MNYEILLKKLEKYGVRGIPLDWFKNYLSNRKQFIENRDKKSKYKILTCGVPQGSNLGPLLFLVYINDLPDVLKQTTPTLFADDTTIHCTAKTYPELERKMNSDLDLLSEWFKSNKLTLNVSKSYGCVFGIKNNNQVRFEINGSIIELTGTVKYLGVIVDSKLTWIPHISSVANKIGQSLGALAKVKHMLNVETLRSIYYALIHSRLIYCIEIWGTASKTALQPLFIAQKKCMRLIVGAQSRAHTEPIFKRLGIRPFLKEIEYLLALLAYKLIKNCESSDIDFVIEHVHGYRTRFASHCLPLPKKRTTRYGIKGLEYSLIEAYNSLPNHVKRLQPVLPKNCKKIINVVFSV